MIRYFVFLFFLLFLGCTSSHQGIHNNPVDSHYFRKQLLDGQVLMLLPSLDTTGGRFRVIEIEGLDRIIHRRLRKSEIVEASGVRDLFEPELLAWKDRVVAPLNLEKLKARAKNWQAEHQASYALLVQIAEVQNHRTESQRSKLGKDLKFIRFQEQTWYSKATVRLYIIGLPDGNLAWYGRSSSKAERTHTTSPDDRSKSFSKTLINSLGEAVNETMTDSLRLSHGSGRNAPIDVVTEKALISVLRNIPR